jgi:hypothetical protein
LLLLLRLLPYSISLLLLLLLQLISCKVLHDNICCWPDRLIDREHSLDDGRRFERPPACHARVHIFQKVVRVPCSSRRHTSRAMNKALAGDGQLIGDTSMKKSLRCLLLLVLC